MFVWLKHFIKFYFTAENPLFLIWSKFIEQSS
jgi:hypothetical protein